MNHYHKVSDSGAQFVVDADTRTIRLASAAKMKIVQNDHNSERLTFVLPRHIDGHDMLACHRAEVHYVNTEAGTGREASGRYIIEDLQIDQSDPCKVICTWLISRNATEYVGTLRFLLRFSCFGEEDTEYVWSTAIYSAIHICEGLFCDDDVIEKYPDVLLQWESRLDAMQAQIHDLQYDPIVIKNFTNSVGTAEIGSAVRSLTFSWSLNKTPDVLTLDGEGMLPEFTGYSKTGLHLTEDRTFILEATDERGLTVSREASITFLNGVYFGVAEKPQTIDSAFVRSLTKNLRSDKRPLFTVNAYAGEYIYYCIPTRFGDCSFTVDGVTGGFTKEGTIAFTNASGYTEDYDVYRSDYASLGATTVTVG